MDFLQQSINGLGLGAIYALIALGYTMVYGVLRFINFAHSDVLMLGAFTAFYLAPKLEQAFGPQSVPTVIGVFVLLVRKNPGFLLAVLRAPFIQLTVTDRRIVWRLPWMKVPLMEIGRERVLDGILGSVEKNGAGSAAVVLVPGDPCADIDGNIHFDRLPDVVRFVGAVRAW